MTTLVWDQAGERRYETGIDRGVLYPPSEPAVPWNGLISVNETVSREATPYFIDGIKFLDHYVTGTYVAKISAFTYPDEMNELVGIHEFGPGIFVHDQRLANLFNLSYRTKVGNDLEGIDYGYKIHILYNLTAILNDTTMDTISDNVEAQAFEWTVSGVPSQMAGIRPTSHISLDSRRIDSTLLETFEALLYGSEGADPSLPTMIDLLTMVESP